LKSHEINDFFWFSRQALLAFVSTKGQVLILQDDRLLVLQHEYEQIDALMLSMDEQYLIASSLKSKSYFFWKIKSLQQN